MELILRQNRIDNVHIAWKNQYPDSKLDIRLALENLSPKTKKDVDLIIGNSSWTENKCDECGKDVEVLIQLGKYIDVDSSVAYVCKRCLRTAIKLMNSK